MVLNECLIIKENKVLVLKNGNKYELPSVDHSEDENVESFLEKYMIENFGINIEVVQIFNAYQIIKSEKNVNVNVYEANILNEKNITKINKIEFLSKEDLTKNEVSETLKLVVDEL